MTDYKAMYLKLFGAVEDAINLLVQAQNDCEDIYINTSDEEDEENNQ